MEGRLRATEAALDRLDELLAQDCSQAEAEMIQWLRTQYNERIRRISACCVAMDRGSRDQLIAFRRLQHEMLTAERRTAIRLRNQGEIGDEVLHRIERDLDLEETRLGG
jgi:CPA1 family monovalent cation:H+ antiporter